MAKLRENNKNSILTEKKSDYLRKIAENWENNWRLRKLNHNWENSLKTVKYVKTELSHFKVRKTEKNTKNWEKHSNLRKTLKTEKNTKNWEKHSNLRKTLKTEKNTKYWEKH